MASKLKITSFFKSETEGKDKQPKTRVQWLEKASFQQAWKLGLPMAFSLVKMGKCFVSTTWTQKKAKAFITGCGDFLKDYIKKHNSCVDNSHALQECTLKNNMETSILTAHKK